MNVGFFLMNSSGSDLSKTLQPISIARGLPNEHYVDHSVFEEEKKAVFENTKHYQDNWKKYSNLLSETNQ